jgi:folate-binding protein YgfZ
MTSRQTWHDFLSKQTAASTHLTPPDSPSSAQLMDLDHLGIIAVCGADTDSFLQGQLSCDLRRLSEQQSISGSLNTLKGRTISTLLLIRRDNTVYLLLRRNLVANVIQILKKYIVFSKATLEDKSDTLICFALQGNEDAATSLIKPTFTQLDTPYSTACVDDLHCIKMPGTHARYLLMGSVAAAEKTWLTLAQNCSISDSQLWQRAQIEAGLAEVSAKTQEQFLPHNLNLHLTGGISFEKGCYTGQEIIARMHYRSTPKNELFICTIHLPQSDSTLRAEQIEGSSLYQTQGGQVRAMGEIVNATEDDAHTVRALALLPKDFSLDETNAASFLLEQKEVHLSHVQRPPYAINNK